MVLLGRARQVGMVATASSRLKTLLGQCSWQRSGYVCIRPVGTRLTFPAFLVWQSSSVDLSGRVSRSVGASIYVFSQERPRPE